MFYFEPLSSTPLPYYTAEGLGKGWKRSERRVLCLFAEATIYEIQLSEQVVKLESSIPTFRTSLRVEMQVV